MESQARITQLTSNDLQAKLVQAFADNEELAKKLKEKEDALRDKVLSDDCLSVTTSCCVTV